MSPGNSSGSYDENMAFSAAIISKRIGNPAFFKKSSTKQSKNKKLKF
jgi:hypothetical protein